MNILMCGGGKGSFEVRGIQLGGALGARVTSTPTDADWRWADVAVLHKKWAPRFAPAAHQAKVPIVWDAIDCWQQPAENGLDEASARRLFQQQIAAIRPALVIGSTQAQADAAGGVYLPHHSWPGLEPTPARPAVQVVGYEGNPAYLGAWRECVKQACAKRGWQFVINPPDLRAVDIFVAFRDGPWDGWMCREWKSGVKYVNAIAAGRPIITQLSSACREILPPGSCVTSVEELDCRFDEWSTIQARCWAVDECRVLAPRYRLGAVAQDYREILESVMVSCPV